MKRALLGAAAVGTVLIALTPATAHAAPGPWRTVALPLLWSDSGMRDISAASASSVWIAGYQGAYCIQIIPMTPCNPYSPGNPVVRQWNGSGWKEYPIRGWSGQGKMHDISAHGSEVWAAGGPHDLTYLARFDGAAFQPVTKPAGSSVYKVWTGGTGTWVQMIDQNTYPIYRRTGDGWTKTALPTSLKHVYDLNAGSGGTEAWAVGVEAWDLPSGESVPAAARWNGTTWESLPLPTQAPASKESLLKVAPAGPGAAWAVTHNSLNRWNGTAWTTIVAPAGHTLRELAVDGTGTPWLTADKSGYARPVVLRYSGGAWQETAVPSVTGATNVTAVPGTETLWGLGYSGKNPVVATTG